MPSISYRRVPRRSSSPLREEVGVTAPSAKGADKILQLVSSRTMRISDAITGHNAERASPYRR